MSKSATSSKQTKNGFLQNMLKGLAKKNPVSKVGSQPKLKLANFKNLSKPGK